MKRIIKSLGLCAVLSLAVWAAGSFVTLDEMSSSGNNVIMTLSAPAKYHAFKISNPPRLVVEFSNTEHNVKKREQSINGDIINRIRSGQFQNEPVKIARVVVDLNKAADYELKGEGNVVTLSFSESPAKDKAVEAATPAAAAPAATAPVPAATAAPDATAATAPIVAPVPAATPLEPASPATTAEPSAAEQAKLPIQEVIAKPIEEEPVVPTDQAVKAAAKPDVIAPKPQPAPAVIAKAHVNKSAPAQNHNTDENIKLPTMPVSIDFQDADIRDVLRVLAMKSGINVIYGPDVEGTITIKLDNVPFNRAFETILSLKGLVSQEQSSNILRVATPQKISDERAQAVTFTKIFPLNYAKAAEIKGNLDSVRQAEGRKGNIAVDSRTNSLIVTDTPEGLSDCDKIISDLDKKPRQVCIEARIVELNISNTDDLGIQWQYAQTNNKGNTATTVGMTNTAAPTSFDGVAGTNNQPPANTINGGTGVSLAATAVNGSIGAFTFGLFKQGEYALDATLSALSQRGKSKILSAPKVTTINNQTSHILVGQKIPYTTTTVTAVGTTQETQFLDVGVKLTVTPTINADKRITLNVKPEVSLFVRADPAGPVIGSREAETTVLVNNGETVVIGGLITDQDIKQGTSVPLLGDIPIIGHLFRRDYQDKERTELLVFITPRILEN